MIFLLFVDDGERDAVMIPRLVERILGIPVREESRSWARLHGGGKGYGRKLLFAVRQARDLGTAGVVAVVDTDRDPKRLRLRELREAREADRTQLPPFPTALGQAMPHGEAWLLDDPVAVRQVLELAHDVKIVTIPRTKDPKAVLEDLWKQSKRAGDRALEVWRDISQAVDPLRYLHPEDTGFRLFAEDVHNEIGASAAPAT